MTSLRVTNEAQLAEALKSGAADITVEGTISGSPMITLPVGATLRGGTLKFGAKGVRLTSNNTLDGVTIETADDEIAILNDTAVPDMGVLTLRNVRTIGQVLILAEDAVRRGHVQIERLHVERADVRGRDRRPRGFGVEALQGGLTIWNLQPDEGVTITAEVLDVSIGAAQTPVHGSGVFVGGHGDTEGHGDGGVLKVSRLSTGEVFTDGRIPAGTADLISGGVFVISGATVGEVVNAGQLITNGQNDMVLDNWGKVDTWTVTAPVTSTGPSGIGFVNFGDIGTLDVQAPINTHGKGARGFNLYDGSLREARFAGIETTGDGSIGIQVSRPMGTLTVTGGVATIGGEGMSLVKGVQTKLKAIALSIKQGGEVDRIVVRGSLSTRGDDVSTVEIEGRVARLEVGGGIKAYGKRSDAVHVAGIVPGLDSVEISAADGKAVVFL